MSRDSKFTIQLLEKIGAPLMAAIDKVVGEGEVESAQVMAQLLGQVTQISMKLYNVLKIEEAEDQVDSTRLALATLAAPLVADVYARDKQVPSEEQLKRIDQALEAVVSFGENFSSAGNHQTRLQTMGQETILFDKDQPTLVVLQAMVPVMNAVGEFPFGQSERKLVQDIATRLEKEAAELAQKNGSGDKLKELIIFKALAGLYASCHLAEIQAFSAKTSAERGELSLDPIWNAFETKLTMMEALMGLQGEAVAEGGSDTQAPAAPQQEQPAAPVVENAPQESPPAGGGGPMGFFKKGDDNQPATAAPTEAAASAPAAQAPATEAVPAEAKAENGEAPSSPMGFFKPGAKKEDSDS